MIKEIFAYLFGSVLVRAANKGKDAVKKYETASDDEVTEDMPERARPWNMGEVNYLKANHDSSSTAEMSEYLGRTPMAIRSKLRRMRVKPGAWEKDEDEYLILNHAVVPFAVIANHLQRPEDDVRARVIELELHKEH